MRVQLAWPASRAEQLPVGHQADRPCSHIGKIGRNSVGYLAGTKTAPAELDLVAFEAQHHVVSPCAMRVKRDRELGTMTPYSPSSSCGCYYEKMANGSTACTPCTRTSDCPSQTSTCSFGYCETAW